MEVILSKAKNLSISPLNLSLRRSASPARFNK